MVLSECHFFNFQLEDDFAMYPILPKTEQATETNDHEESTTKFTIVESPVDHNGIERVVADGLLTEDQCKGLLELTEVYATSYFILSDSVMSLFYSCARREMDMEKNHLIHRKRCSKVSQYWMQLKYTILLTIVITTIIIILFAIMQAAVKKEANYTQVGMYLNSSKSVLEVVREQFNLQDLHFSFTHLVCRTAKDGIIIV